MWRISSENGKAWGMATHTLLFTNLLSTHILEGGPRPSKNVLPVALFDRSPSTTDLVASRQRRVLFLPRQLLHRRLAPRQRQVRPPNPSSPAATGVRYTTTPMATATRRTVAPASCSAWWRTAGSWTRRQTLRAATT
jgi:hypothetical protein